MTDEDRARIVAAVLCGELPESLGAEFLEKGVTHWTKSVGINIDGSTNAMYTYATAAPNLAFAISII